MTIRHIIAVTLLTAAVGITSAPEASAGRKKVTYKHTRVHHRHRIGLRHIGRGTKVKTETKVQTTR